LDAIFFSEQELTCSICLDLFVEPVSTPCGHNFCQACIGGYWASSSVCTCPLCKHNFDERPLLNVNKVFALISEKYRIARYGAAAAMAAQKPDAAASSKETVWCDVCTGIKEPAVSSCLTCTASYCNEHVKPHESSVFYSKHQLLHPQEALKGRTCSQHRRLMEVFCQVCQKCICAICVLEEHRTHRTVSVQTERLKQLILNRIKERELYVGELNKKLDSAKNYADRERGEVEQLLDQVAQALERIRTDVVGGIEEQVDTVMTKGWRLVSSLEAELTQLTEKRATLEMQAISQDHIGFLQSFDSATAPLEEDQLSNLDSDSDFSLHFHLVDVKSSLTEVKEKMEDIRMGSDMSRISSGDLMAAESVMSLRGSSTSLRKSHWSLRGGLNPLTAYPFLILSEDRKQVKRGEKLQFYRNSSLRFYVWSCVSGKEAFSCGRHYWEVFVGENKDWKLGVVTESAQRKGLFDMSPSNGYYAIWWSGSQLRALTAPPLTKVKNPQKLRQVGIFLDMDMGQVTFFNSKSGSEIYSFTGTSEFTERMFPLLGTGDKEVPLHQPAD
uniref:Bloodthirsty-related gene family, member 30 n=1 Tax=Cynoglossus semilaevis TaxID=244447 RepID=A0A3P8VDK0_CYNSE